MHPVLRLYEDVLSSRRKRRVRMPPLPRFIFVVQGSATIDGKTLNEGEAWQGEGAVTVKPSAQRRHLLALGARAGSQGSTTANAPGMLTHEKLTAFLETLPKGELLMRGDRVAFPPGGCAFLHRHQGPGIRCLIEGGIRIDTHGRSTSLRPRRRLVRGRSRSGVRASRDRQAEPLHPRDDPAARARWAKARSTMSTKRTRRSRSRSNIKSTPMRRSPSRPRNRIAGACAGLAAIKLTLSIATFAVLGYLGNSHDKRIAGVLLTFPILNGIGILTAHDPLTAAGFDLCRGGVQRAAAVPDNFVLHRLLPPLRHTASANVKLMARLSPGRRCGRPAAPLIVVWRDDLPGPLGLFLIGNARLRPMAIWLVWRPGPPDDACLGLAASRQAHAHALIAFWSNGAGGLFGWPVRVCCISCSLRRTF